MISEKMFKSFLEALADSEEKAKIGGRHLLLGNGFSIAAWPRFKNSNLCKIENLPEELSHLKELFDSKNIKDHEEAMRRLSDAELVLSSYNLQYEMDKNVQNVVKDLQKRMQKDRELLRNNFVKSIVDNHPEKPDFQKKEKYQSCRDFLMLFDSIFTLNYDLLSYWTIVVADAGLKEKFSDGFGSDLDYGNKSLQVKKDDINIPLRPWSRNPYRPQNFWYLHGALHLFANESGVYKICYNDRPIIQVVEFLLYKSYMPLIVAEGSAQHKRAKIASNPYLAAARENLYSLTGSLFTLGVSFREEDQHILEAIHKSQLSDVYVGVYKPKETGELHKIKDRIRKIEKAYGKNKEKNQDQDQDKHEPTYHFYSTVDPWKYEEPKKPINKIELLLGGGDIPV